MCEILVKASNSEVSVTGDLIFAAEDNHTWGREERKSQWTSEGLSELDWKNNFVVIKIPSLSVSDFNARIAAKFPQVDMRQIKVDLTKVHLQNLLDVRTLGETTIDIDTAISTLV